MIRFRNRVLLKDLVMARFDADYCRACALVELKLAAQATSPAAAEAHRDLATRYRKRATQAATFNKAVTAN